MPLPPTPWLNPPDYVGAYTRGMQIGATAAEARERTAVSLQETQIRAQEAQARLSAQMAEQQQRIEAQKESAALQAATRLKIADQNARMRQQKIEIDANISQMQLDLQNKRLQEAARATDFKIRQSAQMGQAAMEVEALKKQGVKDVDAWLQVAPKYGASFSEMGLLLGQKRMAEIPHKEVLDAYTESRRRILEGGIRQMKTEIATPGVRASVKTGLQDEVAKQEYELENLLRRGGESTVGLPMPQTVQELKEGEIYRTKRGLARWDGQKFNPL